MADLRGDDSVVQIRILPSRTARHKSMEETRPVTFPFLRIGTRWILRLHMIRQRSVTGVSSSAEMAGLVMMVLTGMSIGSGVLCSAQNGLSPGRGCAGGASCRCRPRSMATTLFEGRPDRRARAAAALDGGAGPAGGPPAPGRETPPPPGRGAP